MTLLDRVPDRRADPCAFCGGDHTELTCMVRRSHMGWVENHIEEIEEHMIEIMKDKFKEYGLDTFFTTPDDLDDLVDPYYWSVDNLGDEIANQLSRDAEQAFLERGIP